MDGDGQEKYINIREMCNLYLQFLESNPDKIQPLRKFQNPIWK